MSDIELVIKIPEEKLKIIKNKMYCGIYDPDLYKAIENGTPLDKIRAEIDQITDTMGVSYNQYVSKIDVLKIIDKYREG